MRLNAILISGGLYLADPQHPKRKCYDAYHQPCSGAHSAKNSWQRCSRSVERELPKRLITLVVLPECRLLCPAIFMMAFTT